MNATLKKKKMMEINMKIPSHLQKDTRPEQMVILNTSYVETHLQFSLATHPLYFYESTKE